MIKCMLIEDNPNDMKLVRKTLDAILEEKDIYHIIQTSSTAVGIFPEPLTLYIVDIDLPELSGLDFAMRVQYWQPSSAIAFCSANKNFVWNSQPLDSFFFIRKDNLDTDLRNAVNKYLRNYKQAPNPKFLEVIWNDSKIRIPWENILYIQAQNCHVKVYYPGQKEPLLSYRRFKSVSTEASSHMFLKLGRSHLINLSWVDQLREESIQLKNGDCIPAGRVALTKFRKEYLEKIAKEMI